MGKHETGYARVERDHYPTPHWVVDALAEHVDLTGLTVWEPACGDGRMVEALRQQGVSTLATLSTTGAGKTKCSTSCPSKRRSLNGRRI